MTLSLAINGTQATRANLTIPYYGAPVMDVELASPIAIPAAPGAVSLVVGNLTIVSTAYRAAIFAGSRSVRAVGGFGGWRSPIVPRSYNNSSGTQLSMVLKDLASEVGEKLSLDDPDVTLAALFVREGSTSSAPVPASRILRQMAGPLWWISPDGTTHVAALRPSSPISSAFTVSSWSGETGSFEIATEDPASWMPGATFKSDTVPSPQTISSVSITSGNDGVLRLRVLTSGAAVAS